MRNWVLPLGVRQEETGLVTRLVAIFSTTQMTHAFGANAADALFLVRFGVSDLPLMISLSGLAVMIATLLHGIGLARLGSGRWLWLAALGSALWAGLGWASTGLDQPWTYAVIWISTQAIVWLTFTMMWNGAEAACDTRQAKRLFPLFAAGGILGGVAGNLLSGPVAVLLGAEQLLLLQSLLLVLSSSLLFRTRHLFADQKESIRPTSIGSDLSAALRAIRSSPLLSLAAAAAFLISILFFLVVFPFNEAVASAFRSEEEVAGYLGVFSSVAAAVTFLVSLLLTKRLFATWGIVLTLAAVPLIYLAGFSVWLVSFGLATASLIRGLQWVAVNAVGSVAYPALFNVLTGRRRGQVMTFMTAVPAQLGTVLAGFVLIVGFEFSRPARFGLGLALSAGLVLIVLAMRPAYTSAILTALGQGLYGVLAVPQRGLVTPVDADARRILVDRLDDARADTRALAVVALARAGDEETVRHLEPLMSDEDPLVRIAAFDSMCTLDPNRILDRAESAISDPAGGVRLRALRVVAAADADQRGKLALTSLQDPDPVVAAAAAAMVGGEAGTRTVARLLASQEPDSVAAVLGEVVQSGGGLAVDPTPYLQHPHQRVRAAAAAAFPFWNGNPRLLLPGLDDPSLRVRRASALSLALSPEGRGLVNEVLESGTVVATDVVLRTITPAQAIEPGVIQWANREARRVSRLRSLKAALRSAAPSPTIEFLAKVLSTRASRLEQWVLTAITTTATEEVMPTVQLGLRATDPETRAQAVEALEMTGDRRALAVLLPLLEWSPTTPPLDARSALRELLGDFDPWIRGLATRSLAEAEPSELPRLQSESAHDPFPIVRNALPVLPDMSTERLDTLNSMDRVIALHRVSMFSELDPEDLELIAKAISEVRYHANESIYVDGAEADEMLVIVGGSAVVSKKRGPSVDVIQTYGPGEHVGELALLGEGRRSADVTAGESGLHGVVITKDDLMSILEERTAVALGMLRTLAKRLADQTAGSDSARAASS